MGFVCNLIFIFKTSALFGFSVNHFRDEVKARAYAMQLYAGFIGGFMSISVFLVLNDPTAAE